MEAEGAVEAKLGHQAQEPPRLEVDLLQRPNCCSQAPVEPEGIEGVGVHKEALHVVGQRLGDGLPGRGRELGAGVRRGSWPAGRRGNCGGLAREAFGCYRLCGSPRGQARPRHAAGQLRRVAPEPPDPARTAKPEAGARLALDRILVRLRRGAARGGNGCVEPSHGRGLRPGEPRGFALGCGDGDEEAQVAPGERAFGEGPRSGRQHGESLCDAAEVLKLAAREAEPLSRVIIETDKGETLVGAAEEEGAGKAAEDAAAVRLLAGEAAEERVEQRGAAVAVEAAALLRGGRHEELGGDNVH